MRTLILWFALFALILTSCTPAPSVTVAPTAMPLPSTTSTPAITPTPICEPPFVVGETIPGDTLIVGGVELKKQTISGEELAKRLGIWSCGDIPGEIPVPIYPGAVQSIEVITIPADIAPLIPDVRIVETRQYLTDDNPEQVLAWYAQALPNAGFEYKGVLDSGVVSFLAGNWHYGLFVTTSRGKTYIVIAAGQK